MKQASAPIISAAPKKIFVLFNCQNQTLIQALDRLLPDTVVEGMSTSVFCREVDRKRIGEAVEADSFIFLTNGLDIIGDHPAKALLPDVRPVNIDPIVFRGFHPDAVPIRKDESGTRVLEGMHSRIAHRGFKQGRSAEDIIGDFSEITYRELGYYDFFHTEQTRFLERFKANGLDLTPAFRDWMLRGPFMHTTNHPKSYVIFDLAVALCRREGWKVDEDLIRFWRPLAEDFLINDMVWPVYPELAEEVGFEGSTLFRFPRENKVLTLEAFVRLELEKFEKVAA
ncbi:WcbI family polysaccharide biosynthesis putative acetyltransferase [Primorskyibacter sp. 2E107]|uniref:WcbI family polysaccharide biosynthesis putative acetyltransferase n=1 Tax=Primorskyibacter sp. 2E107 TaxID=3403458 RepID=UPI003AF7F8C5